jgi:hypothetical protein
VYREELTRDVRLLTLLRAAFFSPGKQEALSTLSCYLAMLLTNIADIPAVQQPVVPSAGSSEQPTGEESIAADSNSAAAATHAGSSGSSSDEDDQSHLSNLLRYVPVVYVEVVVDYLTALRRLDEQQQQPDAAGNQTQVRLQCTTASADQSCFCEWHALFLLCALLLQIDMILTGAGSMLVAGCFVIQANVIDL